jgi:SAM-dependent methyltransferase
MARRGLTVPEQYCLNRVPASERDSILDIGIGGGRTTGPLSEMFKKYIGIDYSDGMVAAAKSLFPNAELRIMDARKLEFPRVFDCVMFSFNGIDSIEYDERRLVFQQIAAVLRPGGYLIYSTHNLQHPRVSVWMNRLFVRELFQAWPRPRPMVRSIINRLNKFGQQSCDQRQSFAYVNDCGGDFGYINTYVDVDKEIETTLRPYGFKVLTVIGNTKQSAGYGLNDSWVYILAQSIA